MLYLLLNIIKLIRYRNINLMFAASMENTWPRMPTAAICSRCAAFIITTVVIRRSRITHFIAIMLFLSGYVCLIMIPQSESLNFIRNIRNYINYFVILTRIFRIFAAFFLISGFRTN